MSNEVWRTARDVWREFKDLPSGAQLAWAQQLFLQHPGLAADDPVA